MNFVWGRLCSKVLVLGINIYFVNWNDSLVSKRLYLYIQYSEKDISHELAFDHNLIVFFSRKLP